MTKIESLPFEELKEMYLNNRGTKYIASHFHCTQWLVKKILILNSIHIRTPEEQHIVHLLACKDPERNKKISDKNKNRVFSETHKNNISKGKLKFNMTKELLIKEYIINKKPCREIAYEYGCSRATIEKYLVKYDIKRRKLYDYPSKLKGKPNFLTLKRNLENNPAKKPEVIEKMKISQKKRFQVPEERARLIKQVLAMSKNNNGKTYEQIMGSKEKAEERKNKFVGDKNPAKRIESRKKISDFHIGKPKSEKHRLNIIKSKDKIRNKTFEEIYGEEKARQIKQKMGNATSMQNNPRWLGGLSYEPYTTDFNKAFKEDIRIRDGFLCLKCGMREEDSLILLKRKLNIHHINYDKKITIKENCCSLCNRCNLEVNVNREHWTKFFQSLLSERYGYKYSENGEIIMEIKYEI